jgi:hypothetical protein
MARTLRRSQVIDWEAANSGNAFLARELRSAERRAIAAASDPTPPAHHVVAPAIAIAETSDTLAVPRHRHRSLVIGGAIAFAAMLGAVVLLTRHVAPSPAEPSRPATVIPEKPIADTAPIPAVMTTPTVAPAQRASAADPGLGQPAAGDVSRAKDPRPTAPLKTEAPSKTRNAAPAGDAAKRDRLPQCDVFGDPHAAGCLKSENRRRQN